MAEMPTARITLYVEGDINKPATPAMMAQGWTTIKVAELAALRAVVDAVRVYLLGDQHTCPDDCSSYNALSAALAAYDKGENDDRAK